VGGARDQRGYHRDPEGSVTLYLSEQDVDGLLGPADAVAAIEECFARMARGAVELMPRERLPLPEGSLAVMAAADTELGFAGTKCYVSTGEGARFAVLLFHADEPELAAVIDANRLGQLRTGAASAVAAKHLARPEATTLGVIGCGWQAESQVACIREALPSITTVVAYCRTPKSLRDFCKRTGATPAEDHREAAAQHIVVTATTSRDPVLRGDWLATGTLVCAMGANVARHRELDNKVIERAAFVCCDSRAQARRESGDLIDPIEAGVLDWLEVHELQEVVAGEVEGRADPEDIVVFKSNGLAAWDIALAAVAFERATERGVGTQL
jgi:ornithine cyclodeaminase/alanine dehydrogenase-like protein (mu-crystallin family)